MSKRKEDDFPQASEQKRARPEGFSEEDQKVFSQCVSQGCSASQSDSDEAGMIDSVQVENFMGYAKLGPVKFGSNVNFVVGNSGKNALLTALLIGLSGGSLGSTLKEVINEGEDLAIISITLRNRGDEAFKSDLYGDSVTVHHYLNRDGNMGYELKGHAGNLVSSEKEELMELLEHFKIQVQNPLSILPQDMAKQLLRIRDESDRYKLFMEATELEHMREGYSQILERKAKSQQEIEQGVEKLEELRRQGVEIEEHFQTMVALDQKLEILKQEKTWALVNETERRISNMINDINVEDQHTIILNHDLEISRVTYNETLQRYIAIHENVLKLNEEAAMLEPKCIEAKEIARRTDRAYRQATAFYNYSQNELSKLDKVSEQLQDKIGDLKKNLEQAETEKQKKISTLREKISNFKDQEDSLVQEIKCLHQSIEKDDEEHSRIKEEEAFVKDVLNEEKEQLNHLKGYKTDPLKRFGPQIRPLLDAIEDAHKQGYFTHKPIGPLGACIRLREPEHALAIESCLKGLLLDFFCDNHKDEQVLQELMKRFYPTTCPDRPQIIVTSFQCELYDVTDRTAYHPDCSTVLSALEIDEAVVANALIDMRNIEAVLLIKNETLAEIHAEGRPKNCNKILTSCGDQVFEGRYYTPDELRPIYLGDMEEEISHLEKEVQNKMTKLSEFEENVASLQNDIKKNREIIDSHYRHLREIKVKVIDITSEIKDLEDEEESQSIDLSVLEDEAQEIKEEIKEVEEKMKTRKEKMDNLRQPKLEAEQRHEEFRLKCSQVTELVESLMEERNQTGLEVTAHHQSVLHYQNRLKHHIDSIQMIKEELAMKERELEREVAQANYICPERITVTRSSDVLDREIDLLTQRIKSENYTHRTREDITRQYQEAKEKYLDLNGRVNNLRSLIETLDEILVQKYDTYHKSRRNLSLQCKLFFDSLLSQWSFCGEMRFNHKNETLSITVQPEEPTCNDVAALAASRQSFTNFLFILTLWSVTESPFRCLDMIDVYMDRKSRKIAMEMILWISHSYQNHQVIMLSPQYLCTLPPSPFLKIHKMPALQRDRHALPCESSNPKED
ncbi:structural maintenance of chromosomes protein 6-like [Dromiciops gliroides]|uniref:structural maintenance of chromosomes protein 6-like n=1 Tax=Dromiciops gliroides TaxID=33562 RepID=UPI001CC81120|nr:structural maintenance of chromosomes protein 6-like [Dromiciops gliroides]